MDIKNIVIAAFVGSLFTLAVQFIINRKQRNQIKDSIDLFLKDIILPTGEKISDKDSFSWRQSSMAEANQIRKEYISALQKADDGDVSYLLEFAKK